VTITMKFAVTLFVCLIAAVSADRVRAPAFVVRDGILVRSDHLSGNDDNTLSQTSTKDSRFGFANGRIVGGGDAARNSAPWMISLQWGTIRPNHFCGGALIQRHWVLSAAHCSASYPAYGIATVVSGLHNLTSWFGYEQARNVERDQVFLHEDWSGFVGPHDISLIFVERAFVYDFTATPVTLPDAGEIHTGTARLHGWGSTSDGFLPNYPTVLQTIEKPIVPLAQCRAALEGVEAGAPIHDNNVCTGPLTGGSSSCSGDSGSPITQDGEIIGIVSWNYIPCGQPNRPTVYARISAYISWINDTMNTAK